MRPLRYFVEYGQPDVEDGDEDPADYRKAKSFADLPSAFRFAREQNRLKQAADVYERINIRDVTPHGDLPGLVWDFDEKMVDDE